MEDINKTKKIKTIKKGLRNLSTYLYSLDQSPILEGRGGVGEKGTVTLKNRMIINNHINR